MSVGRGRIPLSYAAYLSIARRRDVCQFGSRGGMDGNATTSRCRRLDPFAVEELVPFHPMGQAMLSTSSDRPVTDITGPVTIVGTCTRPVAA